MQSCPIHSREENVQNLTQLERALSMAGGILLFNWSLRSLAGLSGAAIALVGAGLMQRGYSGYCQLTALLQEEPRPLDKLDKTLESSFPASDPPALSGITAMI